jgi:hypothetical protein
MALPNIFTKEVSEGVIDRINHLTNNTQAKWGKMTVSQMLAHCCVSYEYVYDNNYKKPGLFMSFILKNMVKSKVVNEEPYKPGLPTAKDFVIVDARDFEKEKNRLIAYIRKTQEAREAHFDGKESHSFGKLSKNEWNNMFYKHMDHHLKQFGV